MDFQTTIILVAVVANLILTLWAQVKHVRSKCCTGEFELDKAASNDVTLPEVKVVLKEEVKQ